MRYLVLMRRGLWHLDLALIVDRAPDGEVSCIEPIEQQQSTGMRWLMDGRFWLAVGPTELRGNRTPLASLRQPEVAYSIPGSRLLSERLPHYSADMPGATVQINAHAVLEEPHRVALQLILAPRGQEPYHRETVGDRWLDDNDPRMWIVLDREGDEPTERVAVKRAPRWPPPLRAAARP